MRITGMIFFLCLGICTQVAGQKLTISEKNAPLLKVLRSIEKQTGYQFFFSDEDLKQAKPVSLHVKEETLTDVLRQCFAGQPLEFEVIGKTVVVKRKRTDPSGVSGAPASGSLAVPPATSGMEVKGTVVNNNGEPLPGASVVIKQTTRGVVTDAKGNFALKNTNPRDTFTVSFIGYKSRIINIGDFNKNAIQFVLMEATDNKLDQMVVQAYGKTSQRLTTGNIVRVSGEDIAKQPVMNPLLALQGRVAGLVITPANGYASGTVKVEIRGRSTINSQFVSDPLYVIDGVPLTTLDIGGTSFYQSGSSGVIQNGMIPPAGGQSPLFNLNPSDIESMEVLKDADATAIYGSRAANGVILITTKKGQAGATRFDANVTQGVSTVTRYYDMLNTPQYLQMRREAFKNDGIIPTAVNAPDLTVWDTTKYTDWQKELWGHSGKVTDVSLGLSGGDSKTQFRISGNYHKQTEILTNSGDNQRGSMAFSLTHHSQNNKLTVALMANYSYSDVNSISTVGSIALAPDAPPIYDDKGSLNYSPWNAAGIAYPFASLLQPYSSKTSFLTSNLQLTYELMKGLTFTASAGYNTTGNKQVNTIPIISQNPLFSPTGQARFGTNDGSTWMMEPQLNYKTFIGAGELSILAGGTIQSTVEDADLQYGIGYTNDGLIRSIANAPVILTYQNYGQYKYAALFGRINYNWANKYTLNLNARRDGSSRFGPNRQYGNFGSAGVAWIASEEKWLKAALPAVISFIKLRGSYGLTGSDAIGDYQYLSQWNNTTYGNPLYSYGGVSPLLSQHAVNQDYRWQVNKKLEGALNVGLFNDRINLEAAYYNDRCDNQLTQYPTPEFTGFSTVTANWPATVQNSGLELLLNAKIIRRKDFSWTSSLNIAFNRNRLVAYNNIDQSPYVGLYKVGQSLNTVFMFHSTGVDPATGQNTFEDVNHDGQILTGYSVPPGTGIDDRYIGIDLSPRYTGGFINEFSYKGFQLSFAFSFKKQEGIAASFTGVPGLMSNLGSDVLNDHWQKPGDNAKYARFTTAAGQSDLYYTQSDAVYGDASYIRLSNLALSYNLPERIIKKASMKACRLFIYAQNLFVITGYKGLDPETQNFGSLPPSRILTGGLSLTF